MKPGRKESMPIGESVVLPSGNDPRMEPEYNMVPVTPYVDRQKGDGPTPAKKPDKNRLIPAIKIGGKTYRGNQGDIHANLIHKVPEDDLDQIKPDHLGFIDTESGEFYTRASLDGLQSQNLKAEDLIDAILAGNGITETLSAHSSLTHLRHARKPGRRNTKDRYLFRNGAFPIGGLKASDHKAYPEVEISDQQGKMKTRVIHPEHGRDILRRFGSPRK